MITPPLMSPGSAMLSDNMSMGGGGGGGGFIAVMDQETFG
jgi:hypothetical protein